MRAEGIGPPRRPWRRSSAQQGQPWQVRLVNLMKVLDPKDVFRKTTGMDWEDIYNTRLARGWSVGLAQELKLLQALIRFSHRSMASRLKRHWRKTRPDMVVSLIPNFNRPMYEGVAAAHAARALRHHPHRFRGLPAALLDRAAAGAAFHLRHAEGGGAGARAGLRRGQRAS